MSKVMIESGFGSILSYLSGKASLASTINNLANYNNSNKDIDDLLKTAISATQTGASVWEMIGKELYTIKIAGRVVPVAAGAFSLFALVLDFRGMKNSYAQSGAINNSDIYSALGNIASFASTLALFGAVAASSPFLLSTATVLTVAGVVLTLASMASKDSSVDLAGILNDVRDSLTTFFRGLVWNCCFPILKSKK